MSDIVTKLIIGGIAAAVLSGAGLYIWHRIDKAGYDRCQAEYVAAQAEANTKIIAKKKVIRHETQSLDRDGVIRELCAAGWVRNPKDCPK